MRLTTAVRPDWVDDLTTLFDARAAWQFVLHFNLTDLVIDMEDSEELPGGGRARRGGVVERGDRLPTLREYLRRLLLEDLGFAAIYTYSLADGMRAIDGAGGEVDAAGKPGPAWDAVRDALATLGLAQGGQPAGSGGPEANLPDGLRDNFRLLGHLLRHEGQAGGAGRGPVAVVLDYAEKLIPFHLGEGHGDRQQLQALEVVQRWAVDPVIRRSDNLVVLLTDNIGLIPPGVHAEGSGCRAIRVPLPALGERAAFIGFAMTRAQARLVALHPDDFGTGVEEQVRGLARATQGMRLTDIDNLSRRVIIERRRRGQDEMMRMADLQRAKGDVIEAQSAGLLEIVPPVRGFAEIGGLQKLKDYLGDCAGLMRQEPESPLVPGGLLLAGPPGTGKTLVAEALANESGFNLVKMRNIQDRWVGSSERNLEMVLDLLEDLHPVVVFVDEVDQALGRRDVGQHGDSGVSARMFSRILEAMSDPRSRGRILWVAATNRADLLDEALLRRFDRVVPLLVPDVDELCRIFATMPRTIAKQSGGHLEVSYGHLGQAGAGDTEPFRAIAEEAHRRGMTGAGVEIVVRRAVELAHRESRRLTVESRHLLEAMADHKPNHDRRRYDCQGLLAIRACNFHSIIPDLPGVEPFLSIRGADRRVDPVKLQKAIDELQAAGGCG